MTPEMGRAIFHKTGSIPESDDALIEAVREAGPVEEEILRTQGRMKGTAQKKPSEGKTEKDKDTPSSSKDRSGKDGKGKAERSGNAKVPAQKEEGKRGENAPKERKDFSSPETHWDSIAAALKDVPQDEIDQHKESNKDCIRCRRNDHKARHCHAFKTIKGTDLPKYPGWKPKPDK